VRLSCDGLGATAVSLLGDGELDALALGQRDPWLLRSDDKDVVLTGGERVVYGILDVDNVEASVVTLTVGDDADTTHVATTRDHGDAAGVELDEVGDLAGGQLDLDGVVDLDGWVWVADTIWGNLVSIWRESMRTVESIFQPLLPRPDFKFGSTSCTILDSLGPQKCACKYSNLVAGDAGESTKA